MQTINIAFNVKDAKKNIMSKLDDTNAILVRNKLMIIN